MHPVESDTQGGIANSGVFLHQLQPIRPRHLLQGRSEERQQIIRLRQRFPQVGRRQAAVLTFQKVKPFLGKTGATIAVERPQQWAPLDRPAGAQLPYGAAECAEPTPRS